MSISSRPRGLVIAALAIFALAAGAASPAAAVANDPGDAWLSTIEGTVGGLAPEAITVGAYRVESGQRDAPTSAAALVETTVDGRGAFTLQLPGGTYGIRFSGDGYATQWWGASDTATWKPKTIEAGYTERIPLHQMARVGSLEIALLDTPASLQRVVSIFRQSDRQLVASKALEAGSIVREIRFEQVPVGAYYTSLDTPGGQTLWGTGYLGIENNTAHVQVNANQETKTSIGFFRTGFRLTSCPAAPKLVVGETLKYECSAFIPENSEPRTSRLLVSRDGAANTLDALIKAQDIGRQITVTYFSAVLGHASAQRNIPLGVVPKAAATVTGKQGTLKAKKSGKVAVTVTAPAGITPTGTISIYRGSTKIGTGTLKGGKVTVTIKGLPSKGKHKLKLSYGGSTQVDKKYVYLTVTAR